MHLAVAGLSHHTAPIEVREHTAVAASSLGALLDRVRPPLSEAVVLSTCNRTELYAVTPEPLDLTSTFEAMFPQRAYQYRPYLFAYEGEVAARHLFQVASGVDSLVFGEAEILGQVRRAWETAHELGASGTLTSHLFQRALAVGKRVRSQTDIGRLPASVSSATVALAERLAGESLEDLAALVIGTGEIGRGVARCLAGSGIKRLMIANHHDRGARELAASLDAAAVPWPVPPPSLAEADIIISSTNAPDAVLGVKDVEAMVALRADKPIYLIDLALPRDIDPEVARLPGVHLRNVDDIESVVAATLENRQRTQPEVDAIVAEEIARFRRWLRERDISSTIRRLRDKSEAIRRAELDWARPGLNNLSDRERALVEQLTTRLVNKLMHVPVTTLRRAAAEELGTEYQRVAREMFDLGGEPPSAEDGREASSTGGNGDVG